MNNNYDYLFKFIIIGDSAVGKSCLLVRFTENRFKTDHEPTLGVQFGSKFLNFNSTVIKIQIWDTAGQQYYKSITRAYYKGSIGVFLVFDTTRRQTFENINKWIYEIKNYCHEKIEIALIGNKCDLKDKREISTEQASKFAQLNGFKYYETSAQSGEQVQQVFGNLAHKIVDKINNNQIDPTSQVSYGIKIGKKLSKKTSGKTMDTTTIGNREEEPEGGRSKCCGR